MFRSRRTTKSREDASPEIQKALNQGFRASSECRDLHQNDLSTHLPGGVRRFQDWPAAAGVPESRSPEVSKSRSVNIVNWRGREQRDNLGVLGQDRQTSGGEVVEALQVQPLTQRRARPTAGPPRRFGPVSETISRLPRRSWGPRIGRSTRAEPPAGGPGLVDRHPTAPIRRNRAVHFLRSPIRMSHRRYQG